MLFKYWFKRILTISPVRLTVSPSLTKRSEPKSTTPTWPASKFMHMPLTPDANLGIQSISEARLSPAAKTYSTSSSAWTLFMPCTRAIPSLFRQPLELNCNSSLVSCAIVVDEVRSWRQYVPDRQDASSLGKARLLLYTTDSLLENGGHFSR